MILFYPGIDKQNMYTTQAQSCFTHVKTLIFPLLILTSLISCAVFESDTVILWTDRPEFALYGEYFNADQNRYKVEIRYFEAPAQRLVETGEYPDIVAASWLNSASIRSLWRPLDDLFKKDGLDEAAFYQRLLSLGKIDNRQYLLPVNFNIPALIFASPTRRVGDDFTQSYSNPFTIEMDEIKQRGKAFNTGTGGIYTRMGFSLSTNDEFLFLAAILFGAAFREASPIAWESQALEQSIRYVNEWIAEANTGVQMEDDFAFKYFFDPPDKLVNSGRILFTYMDSSRFFTLPEERRSNLDFRWIAAREMIPIDEWGVYYGIHRRTRALNGAKAFTRWFFTTETQKLLLEAEKGKRTTELSFGIAGGFSAMRTVTEQVFPQFYPDLLGRIPPENYLSPPNILPRNWISVKERVILPYLRERIRSSSREEVRPLDRRVSDWYRLNRD
jgi:ABC-type glycerol-3-phosphate transport system substrate-binding protein